MFKKDKKAPKEAVKDNKKEQKKTAKKAKPQKVSQIAGTKKINVYEDILKPLETLRIFNANDYNKLLAKKEKGFEYHNLIEFLDDVIEEFGKDKEREIIQRIFGETHGYEIAIERTDNLMMDMQLKNYLDETSTTNIGKDKIQKIIKLGILPISIIQGKNKKIKKMVFISRTPEVIPGKETLLDIFGEIIKKEKILDGEFIIVTKDILDFIVHDLTVKDVQILL